MSGNRATNPLADLIGAPLQPSLGSEAVDRILRAIRDHLGMDVAFVSEFRRSDRIFRHVDARGQSPIRPGDAVPLDQGYCQRIVDGRLPGLMADTGRFPAAMALPETRLVPVGAHLSVPIRLADGRIFGTFCCFSFMPDRSLGERDLQMMQVLASLLADQIDRDLKDQQGRAERADNIQRAIAAGQPVVHYQPIYDLRTRRLAGLEGLARFQLDPQRTPDKWFAEASQIGLSVDLELQAIRAALHALPSIPKGAYLAVNCSPQTILSPHLPTLLQVVDLGKLVLEVTEHAYIDDYPSLIRALTPLRALGMRVAIDDAGAGYASLRHVLHIQPDLIKLDISLTRDIDSDPVRRALGSALIAFARETKARIVAEGVETGAELRTLKKLGADSAQGYYLARPMPLREALGQEFPQGAVGRPRASKRKSAAG